MGICTSHNIHDVRIITAEPPKLLKRESDMNLIPGEVKPQWRTIDESEFDRERYLLLCAPNTQNDRPAKLFIFDVDYQSKDYGQLISDMPLPRNGDEFIYSNWSRSAATSAEMNTFGRNYLIIPCFNTSRIYVIGIDDAQQMRVSKCVELQELSLRDTSFPLDCCSCPGRGTPLFVSTLGDRHGSAKGSLLKMDRKVFTIVQKIEDSKKPTFSNYGGTFAIHARQGFLISTEWGHPGHIQLGVLLEKTGENLYGNALNVWDVEPRLLRQRIELDDFEGNMPICIRFVHNPDLIHAFACTIGGGLYHIHKNSLTDEFTAQKAFQFPNAHVSGWRREEVPALPVDMIISMDDQFLYVSAWLQGFVHQFNIIDPFNVTPANKIFIGGIIHREYGVKLQRISTINFMPNLRKFEGDFFEGGPSRLQLSLDGRRLYVGNSWMRSWDNEVYPRLSKTGSMIVLIHINVNSAGSMNLDDRFHICLNDRSENFLSREMRFLNGDCSSDIFL